MHTSASYPTKHIVILGDGILGVSTALAAIRRGSRVTLVGSGPGDGASWRSFGWLGAAQEVPEPYHALRTLSLNRYRRLADDPAYAAAVRFTGALAWEQEGASVQLIQGADSVESVADTFERLRSIGHHVELLTREQTVAVEPALSPEALPDDGVLFAHDEGWVDLPAVVGLHMASFLALGGAYRHDPDGGAVVLDHGLAAVRLSDGTVLRGDAVLVATGARTAETLRDVGVEVPQRSTKAALLFTEPTRVQPRVLSRTPAGSVRPRPGGGLVVHTSDVENEVALGSDGTVTLDDPAIVDAALERVAAVFRGATRPRLDRLALGLRPIPGDGWPIVGAVASVPGLHVAFSHSGATLGPVIGELLADELIIDGYRSPLLEPYRLSRFAND